MLDMFGGNIKYELIYSQKNIISVINDAGGDSRYKLLYIMDFMTDLKAPSRSSKITSLTHYEKIILKEDYGYKENELITCLSKAYVAEKVRLFYLPELKFIKKIDMTNDVMTIFFGEKIKDPKEILDFIYKFTERIIESRLKDYGFLHYRESIDDFYSYMSFSIKDAEILTTIYANILNVVYNTTNHDVVTFDYIKDIFEFPLLDETMQLIWNYAVNLSRYINDDERHYIIDDSCCDAIQAVYSELKKENRNA